MFFSRKSVFLSKQISRNSISVCFFQRNERDLYNNWSRTTSLRMKAHFACTKAAIRSVYSARFRGEAMSSTKKKTDVLRGARCNGNVTMWTVLTAKLRTGLWHFTRKASFWRRIRQNMLTETKLWAGKFHKEKRNSYWLSTCNNLIHTAQSIDSGARGDRKNTNSSRSIGASTKAAERFCWIFVFFSGV